MLRHKVEYLGNGFFQVESLSAPGEHYKVELRSKEQGGPRCPCKGWQVRAWCSHIDDCIVWAVRQEFAEITVHDKGAP